MNNTIGIVSGYFNPLHAGHLEYINAARKLCDYLICIVNNDYQVELKKSQKFMDQQHRLNIIQNLKSVDQAIIAIDDNPSVSKTIEFIVERLPIKPKQIIFFNSGDRSADNRNILEINICKKYQINTIYIALPKIYSSSKLKRNFSS
jgi:cytidyltransferase-like protein